VSTALDRLHRQRLVHDRPAPRVGRHSPRTYWSAGAGVVVGWLLSTTIVHAFSMGADFVYPCLVSVNLQIH
jgi:hypothetical protein